MSLLPMAVLALVAWELFPETISTVPVAPELRRAFLPSSAIGEIPDLNVAFATATGRLYAIEDHFVFVSDDGGRTFRRRGQLPRAHAGLLAEIKDVVARSKLVRRIRRNKGPENLVVLDSGTILVFWDRIYRSTDDGASFQAAYDLAAHGILAPFGNNEGVAVGPDAVYFGEYSALPRPHAIRILEGTNDGRDWRIAHTFAPGDLFHIHSIAYDRFRHRYWVCTGDDDAEARILYSDDKFRSLQVLGGGSQAWRSVSLMITERALVWGSDNDKSAAAIFRWSFERGRLERLQETGKPSYSSTVTKSGAFVLSTAYEPNSPYTRQFHPGESTDLWMSRDGDCWTRILSLPYRRGVNKDGKATRGSMSFPAGWPVGKLFVLPQSTTVLDFDTIVMDEPPLGSTCSPDRSAGNGPPPV